MEAAREENSWEGVELAGLDLNLLDEVAYILDGDGLERSKTLALCL